jgi:hypothetical protein
MKLLGQIMLAAIALAVLQAAMALAVLCVLVVFVFGLVHRPRETLGLVALCLLLRLFEAQPIVGLMVVCALVLLGRVKTGPKPGQNAELLRLTHQPSIGVGNAHPNDSV